jgi:hypothetical protein
LLWQFVGVRVEFHWSSGDQGNGSTTWVYRSWTDVSVSIVAEWTEHIPWRYHCLPSRDTDVLSSRTVHWYVDNNYQQDQEISHQYCSACSFELVYVDAE